MPMMTHSRLGVNHLLLSTVLLTILGLWQAVLSQSTTPEECSAHFNITESWKRILSYVTTWADTALCDSALRPGWFRAVHDPDTGTTVDIPDSNSAPNTSFACNTRYPLYLKGSNPYPVNTGDSVQVDVCVFVSENETCRTHPDLFVNITNCGSYNVYYLTKPPETCPTAYCFGTEAPDGAVYPPAEPSLTTSTHSKSDGTRLEWTIEVTNYTNVQTIKIQLKIDEETWDGKKLDTYTQTWNITPTEDWTTVFNLDKQVRSYDAILTIRPSPDGIHYHPYSLITFEKHEKNFERPKEEKTTQQPTSEGKTTPTNRSCTATWNSWLVILMNALPVYISMVTSSAR